jgi:calcineurin-like phosphoesterase family protein
MNLYISDLHFGHKNVIAFDHRPFLDADEMDLTMIELWNARV